MHRPFFMIIIINAGKIYTYFRNTFNDKGKEILKTGSMALLYFSVFTIMKKK